MTITQNNASELLSSLSPVHQGASGNVPVDIPQRSAFAEFASNSAVMAKRSIIHTFRIPDMLIGSTLGPIMFVLVFRYVFGGAIQTDAGSYINYMMAGIFVQTISFGAMSTGMGLAEDLKKGVIDRFRSMPMMASTVLVGRTVADQFRNIISLVVMFVVGLLVGFRPEFNLFNLLLAPVLVLFFGLAVSWIMAALALFVKSVEAVNQVGFMAIFPLTFASSAFAPTETMPSWLQAFAANQPLSQVTEATRALLLDRPMGNHMVLAIAWSLAIIVAGFALATWRFRKIDS